MFVFMEPICDDKIQTLLATAARELSKREKHAKCFDAFMFRDLQTPTGHRSPAQLLQHMHALSLCALGIVCVGLLGVLTEMCNTFDIFIRRPPSRFVDV